MTPERCAAQHFGPWMIEPKWFTQAVQAVKAGTFKPTHEATATVASLDDNVVADQSGDGMKVRYIIEDGVARIPFMGQVTKGDSSFGGASSVWTRQSIRRATADERVRAILLHIDSPGGTVAGTADLADDVAAARRKMPVYSYFEDLGASAAYWIGSQATRVFANPTALIGSIGTVAVVEDTSGAMDKAGIKVHVISTGPYKGAFTDGAPVTDDQLADLQREVDDLNSHFLNGVASGRRMNIDAVRKLATGQVWIASEAKQLGLIDEVASLDAAMQAITQEVTRMNADSFRQYAAENPEAAEVKDLVAKGHKAGVADGIGQERSRALAILDAHALAGHAATASISAGHDADTAKLIADAATKARAEAAAEKDAEIAALRRQADQAAFAAGTQGGVGTGATQPATATATKPDGSDPKALAEWEWDNEKPQGFSNKDRYVAIRTAELKGQFRVGARKSA